ncbi:MAG: alpha-galactosidase [Clostridia bacterium]|nr:alpha-galactosidase [Clostridia bacterium]
MQRIRTPFYGLTIGCDDGLITYETPTFTKKLSGPVFEIDGEELLPSFQSVALVSEIRRNANITEYTFRAVYAAHPALTLHLTVRVAEKSPIVKFKYELTGNGTERLTKTNGDKLDYCALRLGADDQTTEVRFSEFNKMIHSFCMNEVPLKDSFFVHSRTVMGPLMAVTDGNHSFLLAYEHGSQYPDAFLHYRLTPAKEIILSAKKGNYLSGTALNEQPFESVWFDFGTVAGSVDDLAAAFREFQLKYVTLNTESRKPYIYYNTWNFQERNKWWNEKAYLADMTEERMLEEIDAAHEMGIEYFVIDTGWYEKTGDWEISTKRFSKDMKLVRERLTSYDMKLGLWIGPTSAGFTSKILKDCPHCELDWNGQYSHRPIWETEESYDMCIVSPF